MKNTRFVAEVSRSVGRVTHWIGGLTGLGTRVPARRARIARALVALTLIAGIVSVVTFANLPGHIGAAPAVAAQKHTAPKRKIPVLPDPKVNTVLADGFAHTAAQRHVKLPEKQAATVAPAERPHGAYIPVKTTLKISGHGLLLSPRPSVPALPEFKTHPAKPEQGPTAELRSQQDQSASPASFVMSSPTVPGAPTEVAATPRDGGAVVSWDAPASDGGDAITGYTITASPGDATADAAATATDIELSGLTDGTAYTFTVAATNAVGTGAASVPSAAMIPEPATNPGPVQDLTVTAGNAQATVSWEAPADDGGADIVDYFIDVFPASGTTAVGSALVSAPTTTATFANLTDGTAYYVTASAMNRSDLLGSSAESADFTPQAGPDPAPPASVTAQPGIGQATVGWTAPAEDGGSAVTGYVITAYDGSTDAQVGSPVSVSASTLSHTVSGLTNGTWYYFGVAATNSSGTGPQLYSAQVLPAAAPSAPTSAVGYAGPDSVLAMWTPPVDDGGSPITGYTVVATGPSGTISRAAANATELFSGLTDGTSYTFTVTASNAVATGPASVASAAVEPSDEAARPVDAQPVTSSAATSDTITPSYDFPVLSGNGRYLFIDEAVATVVEGSASLTVQGWVRYDMDTGQSEIAWEYQPTGNYTYIPNMSASASYDGQVFAGPGASDVYVWSAATGDVVLASANASGQPADGSTAYTQVSANGAYVVFDDMGDTDMAEQSGCATPDMEQEGYGPSSLYRFDVATQTLQRISVDPPASFVPSGGTFECAEPDTSSLGVSGDGSHIAILTDFSFDEDEFGTEVDVDYGLPTLLDLDVSASGAATPTVLAATADQTEGAYGAVMLSNDGNTVVTYWNVGQGTDPDLVTINPSEPSAEPVPIVDAADITAGQMSGNGQWIVGQAGDYAYGEQVLINIATHAVYLASQINSQMASPSPSIELPTVDYTGLLDAFQSTAPELTGETGCYSGAGASDCWARIIVVNFATGTVGVLGTQTLGCACTSALGSPSALQNFVGDPVNTATGSYMESDVDATLPTSMGVAFDFQRTYNSAAAAVNGPLGYGWADPYALSLSFDSSGDATVYSGDGATAVYTKQADGSYQGPPGTLSILAAVSSGYTLTLPNRQVDSFDSTGRLTSMLDVAGKGLTFSYTGAELTGITDADGRVVVLSYGSGSDLLASITLPDGSSTQYGYDTSGRLTSVTDANGKTTQYAYDANNRLTTVTDPDQNVVVSNTYDSGTGRVTAQTEAGGSDPTISWDASDQIATTTDADGRVSKDFYSGDVLIAHEDPSGAMTTYSYDDRLDLVGVTDPDGVTTEMTYDGAGNMLTRTVEGPDPRVESWTYDTHHDMLTYTDPMHYTTHYGYDGEDRPTTVTDPMGFPATTTYNAAGQIASVQDPDGNTTYDYYDSQGNLDKQVDPTGATTTYTYDLDGRMLTSVSPDGNVAGADPSAYTTSYTYDSAGRVQTVTDPDGDKITDVYDDAGNLVQVTDATGAVTKYGYDALGRRTSVTNPDGKVTATEYDADGDVISTTDPLGDESTYAYDKDGHLLTSVSPDGNASGATPAAYTTTYAYDPDGRELSVADPLGDTTQTTYDAYGEPVATTDPDGNVTQTSYNSDGQVATTTGPDGGTSIDAYDEDGDLLSVTDPLGNKTSYTYDKDGRKLSETLPDGEETTWTYDGDGRVKTTTDPRGNAAGAAAGSYTTTDDYDPNGNLISVTDGMGQETQYTYDPANLKVSETDPLQQTTLFGYDKDGRLTSTKDPDGNTSSTVYNSDGTVHSTTDAAGDVTTYGYDDAGRETSMTAPLGNVSGADAATYTTGYGYDASGNRTSVTEPGGLTTTTEFNAADQPVKVTDPLQNSTETQYDADGRVIAVTDPSGGETQTGYDADGDVTSSTDAMDKTTTTAYDLDGREASTTSPLGEKTSYTYNDDGQLTGVTSPLGNVSGADPAKYTTSYAYDQAGNQTQVTDPLGNTTSYSYDADNRQTSMTDADGNTTQYGYDSDGQLTSVTDPLKATTSYGYDGVGDVTSMKDGNGYTTDYGYDPDGRLTSVTDPLNATVSYHYDADGDKTSIVNARGQTTTDSYNPLGELTGTTYSDGTAALSYGYDNDGDLTSATDTTGTHTLAYDPDGNLTSVTEPATGGSLAYQYNADDQITQRTLPDGTAYGYQYDDDGREKSQSVGGDTTTYAYDADSELTQVTESGGAELTENYTYATNGDLDGESVTAAGSALESWQLARDGDGNPTDVATTTASGTTAMAYTYDADGRLLSECPVATTGSGSGSGTTTGAGTTYTYDNDGDRLSQTVDNGSQSTMTSYQYNDADELTSSSTGTATTSYGYDLDGNQTSITNPDGSSVTSTYNAADQISSETTGATGKVTFGYDAFGNRASETAASGTVDLVWDDTTADPTLASSSTGGATTDYAYGPTGDAEQVTTAGATTDLASDWQGDIVLGAATSAAAGSATAKQYSAFGQLSTGQVGVDTGMLGYQGQLINPDATTYDLRARQYDPTTGRFLSRDPVIQPVTEPYTSNYVYALDDPTSVSDPTGEVPKDGPQAPGGPDGFYVGGSDDAHGFAQTMAYGQLAAEHSPANTYADEPGMYGWRGGRWKVGESGTAGAKNGYPDLVVRKYDTPNGPGYGVWDIKSAWGDGLSPKADKQVQSYAYGIARQTGEPATPGEEIAPQWRYWPEEQAIVTIFNKTSADWARYGLDSKQEEYTVTDGPFSNGVILYSVFRLWNARNPNPGTPLIDEFAQGQEGRGRQVQYCFPLGIDEQTRSRMNSWPYASVLSTVGTLTGSSLDGPPGSAGGLADIATEMSKLDFRPPLLVSLAEATVLTAAVLSGPLLAQGASSDADEGYDGYDDGYEPSAYSEQANGGYNLTEDDTSADPDSDSMWNDFDAADGAGADAAETGFGGDLVSTLETAGVVLEDAAEVAPVLAL